MRILRGVLLLVGSLLVLSVLAIFLVPERWVANRMESAASSFLDAELRIGELDLNRFSWLPSAKLMDVTLTNPDQQEVLDIGEFEAAVDVRELISGDLVIDRIYLQDSTVDLALDESGNTNWDFVMEALPAPQEPAPEQNDEPAAIPAIRDLRVENLNVKLDDEAGDRTADLVIAASGSTVNIDQPVEVNIEGDVNGEPANLAASMTALEPMAIPPENVEFDVQAGLGSVSFNTSGTLTDIPELGDVDVDFEIAGNGLQEIENAAGIGLPLVPPFELRGNVDKEDNFFVLKGFDGKLGNTTLAGDIRVDHTTTPITVYANVISDPLDFDDLAGLIGAEPETATADSAENNEDVEASDDGRLLPDGPIDLLPLTQFFNGSIDYRAETVKSEELPISRFDAKIEVEGEQLTLAPVSIDIAGGNVAGSINFDVSSEIPEGVFELEVDRVSLKDLLESTGVDDDSLGIIGGRMKYWVAGNTVSEMATNLDGGAFMLMTEGKLDSLLSEFAGLDIVESISVLVNPDKTLTDIRCAYVDMHSDSGVLDIAKLAIDTEDTVFLADGNVDLNDETLDITVEPHPKDLSVLAARTAVQVGGTLSDPSILPGRSLPLRAAAAAALGALGTPILAVLPFIEAGTGEDSEYCSGLITSLGEVEQEAE